MNTAHRLQQYEFFERIERKDAPTEPGLYMHLWHGREDPYQDMDDWGSDGPYFGPLSNVGFTYGSLSHIRNVLEGESGVLVNEDDCMFQHDDLIFYKGVWYGQLSIFIIK